MAIETIQKALDVKFEQLIKGLKSTASMCSTMCGLKLICGIVTQNLMEI